MAHLALVDSDQDCRMICAAVLTQFGHEVSCFDDVIAAARNPAQSFDAVVVDPGWSYRGQASVVDFLRQLFRATPLVVMSGGISGAPLAIRTHADVRVLAKPFAIETLFDAIDQLLATGAPPRPDA